MSPHLSRALVAAAVLAAHSHAQSFNYPDFSSTSGVSIQSYGTSQPPPPVTPPGVVGTAIRITSSSPISQRGSVFHDTQVAVAAGFDTTFTYSISSQVSGGADGLALVIHNDPRGRDVIGRHASAIGYGAFASPAPGDAITNTLVVEIDTFQSVGGVVNDPNANHIAVMSGGAGDCLQNHASHQIGPAYTDSLIGSSGTRAVRVEYVPGVLKVYFQDLVNPKLTIPYDFATGGALAGGGTVGGLSLAPLGRAWVGFTASTGGSAEDHDLAAWAWTSAGTPPPVAYCTAGTSSNGCAPVISGAGTPSVLASSGFTIEVTDVEGQRQGLIFYGVSGRVAVPWDGASTSYLCVKSPTQRMGVQFSGGSNLSCEGALSQDWLAFAAANPGALGAPFSAGQVVNTQAWYRDPPAAKTTNLSGGLEFTLAP